MKTFLTLFLLTISIQSFAQYDPTLAQPQSHKLNDSLFIVALHKIPEEKRLDRIQLNLLKFSRTYNTGTGLILCGFAAEGLGGVALATGNNSDTIVPTAAIVGGVVLVFTGWVVQTVAHKFLRKASGAK